MAFSSSPIVVTKTLEYILEIQPTFFIYLTLIRERLETMDYILIGNRNDNSFQRSKIPELITITNRTSSWGIHSCYGLEKLELNEDRLVTISRENYNQLGSHEKNNISDYRFKKPLTVDDGRIIQLMVTGANFLKLPLEKMIKESRYKNAYQWYRLNYHHLERDGVKEMKKKAENWIASSSRSNITPKNIRCMLDVTFKDPEDGKHTIHNMFIIYSKDLFSFSQLDENGIDYYTKMLTDGLNMRDIFILEDLFKIYHSELHRCIAIDEWEKYFKIGKHHPSYIKK